MGEKKNAKPKKFMVFTPSKAHGLGFTEIWDTPKARNNKFSFSEFLKFLKKYFLKINSKHKILSRKNKETF
jgi:hypothetical protein